MAEKEFLGTGWGFPPSFSNYGKDVQLVSGEDDIKESLEILFSTALGERYNYEEFGCDLKKFMFEEVNPTLIVELQRMMVNAVINYEPRVDLKNIEVNEAENNAKLLLINVEYFIKETNSEQNMVYPLYIF